MHNNSSTNIFVYKLKKLSNKNYPREKEMIDYILGKKCIKTNLVDRFFAYYPIILQ